ncbi:hypothetical protein H4219_004841 [Mycoemilia scoparia]|uniref:Uncharacterized protein n=1 Tax=Mycoemilia scoparia TaxID=417184 RepID=A0A9W8DR70_9FUNG|nr:hypothetical protein H4219_004841 [Mycoemilia scoparia]
MKLNFNHITNLTTQSKTPKKRPSPPRPRSQPSTNSSAIGGGEKKTKNSGFWDHLKKRMAPPRVYEPKRPTGSGSGSGNKPTMSWTSYKRPPPKAHTAQHGQRT